MDKLIVINYDGDDYINNNHSNLKLNFIKDSGIEPTLILEQPTKDEFIEALNNIELNDCDKMIIHIKSHGYPNGIAKELSGDPNYGEKDSFIAWTDLINIFNVIAESIEDLFINLGTVCNSSSIYSQSNDINFKALTTNINVSNPVQPRKINKKFLNEELENIKLNKIYDIN